MTYRLVITKIVPLSEEELNKQREEYNRRQSYCYGTHTDFVRSQETRTMEVELTLPEYDAVRKSLMLHWDKMEIEERNQKF